MTNQKQRDYKTGILAVVGALLTGVVAGVLLAPKKGIETRKDIARIAKKIGKEVTEKAKKAEKLTHQKYDEIVEAVADSYKKLKKIKKEDIDKITAGLKEQGSEVIKKLKAKK
jgi:gas vesicle protein